MGASAGTQGGPANPEAVSRDRVGFGRLQGGVTWSDFFDGPYPKMASRFVKKASQVTNKEPASFNGIDIYAISLHIQCLYKEGGVAEAQTIILSMCEKAFSDDASEELKRSIFAILKPEYIERLYTSSEQALYQAVVNKTCDLMDKIAAKQPCFCATEVTQISVADGSAAKGAPDMSQVRKWINDDLLVNGIRNLDTDSNGSISFDELSKFFSENIPHMPKAQHNMIMKMLDKDHDGTVSVQELLTMITGQDHNPGARLAMVNVCVNDHTVREPATSTPFGHTTMTKYLTLKLMRMLGSKEFLLSSQYYSDDYTVETQFAEFLAAHDPELLEGGFIGFAPATDDPRSIHYMDKYLDLCTYTDTPNVFLDVNLVDNPEGTAPHMKGSLLDLSKFNAKIVLQAVHKIDKMFSRKGYPDNPWREVPAKAAPVGELYVNFINVLDWLQLKPGCDPEGERAQRLAEVFRELYSDKVFQRRVTAVVIEEGHGLSVPGDFGAVMKWMRNFFPSDCKVPGRPNPQGLVGGYRVMVHCHASHTGHEHVSTLELMEAGGDGIWASFIPDAAQFGHNNIFVFLENMLRFGNLDVWRSWHLEQAIEAARHIYFLNFNTVTVPASYHIWGSAVRSEAHTFFRTTADRGWRRRRSNFYHNWTESEIEELEEERGAVALAFENRRNEDRDKMNNDYIADNEDRWRRVREGDYHIAPLMGNVPTIHRRLQELEIVSGPKGAHSSIPSDSPAHKLKMFGFAVMVADLRANFNDPGFLQQAVAWLCDPPTGPPANSARTWQSDISNLVGPQKNLRRLQSELFGWRFADEWGNALQHDVPEKEINQKSLIDQRPVASLYRMQAEGNVGIDNMRRVRIVDRSRASALGLNWQAIMEDANNLLNLRHPNIEACHELLNSKSSPHMLMVLGPVDIANAQHLLEISAAMGVRVPQSDVVRIGKTIFGALNHLHSQRSRTFDIELDNRDGAWNQNTWPPIVCEGFCSKSLVVSALKEPAHEWNIDHPGLTVEVGHIVIAVNGVSGKASQMREEANKANVLKLKLKSIGLIHTGICAERLFISRDGEVKLSMPRFNHVSKHLGVRDEDMIANPYWSPERAQDGIYDGRDDVWATGCLMAELLAAKPIEELVKEVPFPARGCWDPLKSSDVYMVGPLKQVMERALTTSRVGRVKAANAEDMLGNVPALTRMLGIRVVGVRGLPPAQDGGKFYHCEASLPDASFVTDYVWSKGSMVSWDEQQALTPYQGGDIEFTIWTTKEDEDDDDNAEEGRASALGITAVLNFFCGTKKSRVAKATLQESEITGEEQELQLGDSGAVMTVRVVKPKADEQEGLLTADGKASPDFLKMVKSCDDKRASRVRPSRSSSCCAFLSGRKAEETYDTY